MFSCTKVQLPKLSVRVKASQKGIELRAEIPKEIESKIMVAMRNSLQKKCYTNGILEIFMTTTRSQSRVEVVERINDFCERLTRRSGVLITPIWTAQ